MAETKPAYEVENELAESLGWRPVKDRYRHAGDDAHWCKFEKGDDVIWKVGNLWVRARHITRGGLHYLDDHRRYHALEDALHGRYPVGPATGAS